MHNRWLKVWSIPPSIDSLWEDWHVRFVMPLGKNLSNIIGDYFGDEVVSLNPITKSDQELHTIAAKIPISSILANPFQTRTQFDFDKIRSLAQSIKESGLIHPIIVLRRKAKLPQTETEAGDNSYEINSNQYILLAGERRLRACKLLDYTEILAIIKSEEDLSPEQQALLTAVENLQREDLSPLELAHTFQMLAQTQNLSEEGLADLLGHSTQHIKNYLRLLTLALPLKQALLARQLTEGQARHLVGLPESQQIELLKQILTQDLTVKEIISLLKKEKRQIQPVINAVHNLNTEVVSKAQKLAELFPNSKLKCVGDEKKGRIVIQWG